MISNQTKLKLENYIRKIVKEERRNLKEASEIGFKELDSKRQKQVTDFVKFFNGKRRTVWEGIHGYIVDIDFPMGRNRLGTSDLKMLSGMELRWIEFDGLTVSIGF